MAENKEKSDVAKREEEVLAFWKENRIFEKSEEKDAPHGDFVFYDGPPFATGLPHYGHILAGTIKDAIPRYKTMCGFRVRRKWGWDCHGLPLENEIEKELGLKTKKDIEKLGVGAFNKAARNAVLRYADDWKRIVPRMGRWVDMDHDYKTMDAGYTESIWWAFKELSRKALLYEGFKPMHLCPRCGTTLSNFEVNLGYKDIKDLAVVVKLELSDEPDTFLLVWTTTPWTLPGNMAAAVREDALYVKVKVHDETLIVAESRQEMLGDDYTVLQTIKGAELVGKSYTPPFSYYKNQELEGKENAWKIYHAPYVSLEEGTGAVHLAPVFGDIDLELAQKHGIPLVHHVDREGKFTSEVVDFAGMLVKSKDDHQSADRAIIESLEKNKVLFRKETIEHSYPLCWRCDTPLLVYASSSWFVKVTALRDKLVRENKKIHWVPKEVGEKRFGHWLEGARDWAISRARYWGAPLPVWKGKKSGAVHIIGSVEELKRLTKTSGNAYFLMRHGEAQSNATRVVSSGIQTPNHLTETGKKQVIEGLLNLKKQKVDLIISSPLMRTRETSDIVARGLEIPKEKIIFDDRLREIEFGVFNERSRSDYWGFFNSPQERFHKAPKDGENLLDVKKRVGEFLYELEKKYSGRKILIIAHEDVLWMLSTIALGASRHGCLELKSSQNDFFQNGEVRPLDFVPLPHNENYELDLHRPFIDEIALSGADGEALERVPDVFDCWFESGSMPYAQHHYPFEQHGRFVPIGGIFKRSKGYPADFIAEGLDQTRGWFYSLIVLGTALFGRSAYKNVIVNGLVLGEDGTKLSKRLKNYADPLEVVSLYGADALRYYLLSSPIMRGEDLVFSVKGVEEVMRKNILRLQNVFSFFELYRESIPTTAYTSARPSSTHVLDRWALARFDTVVQEVTEAMDRYELDRAARPLAEFIDDFSTWYLRRSRDRFKHGSPDDRTSALMTTRFVLAEVSKIIAPFMPFFAEWLYREVKLEQETESVHLASWPQAKRPDTKLLALMRDVRTCVSLALEVRARSNIKVRQPLSILSTDVSFSEDLVSLIKDEVNVKNVHFDPNLKEGVSLDTHITPELQKEGYVREFMRFVQEARKREKLHPSDEIILTVHTSTNGKDMLTPYIEDIQQSTLARELRFKEGSLSDSLKIGEESFSVSVSRT